VHKSWPKKKTNPPMKKKEANAPTAVEP